MLGLGAESGGCSLSVIVDRYVNGILGVENRKLYKCIAVE